MTSLALISTQAAGLASRMVTRWGMSDRLGQVQLGPRDNPYLSGPTGYAGAKPLSENIAEAIDTEVRRIAGESYEEAKRLLTAHGKQLDPLAAALVARETATDGASGDNEIEYLNYVSSNVSR